MCPMRMSNIQLFHDLDPYLISAGWKPELIDDGEVLRLSNDLQELTSGWVTSPAHIVRAAELAIMRDLNNDTKETTVTVVFNKPFAQSTAGYLIAAVDILENRGFSIDFFIDKDYWWFTVHWSLEVKG